MKQNFTLIFTFFFLVFWTPSFATGNELAQSKPVQKAVEEVETSVDGLVTARDENIVNDLALRIDAFKKVIDLSLAEAKDLQIRALLIEKDPKDMALWREKTIIKIEDAVRYFELLKKKGVAHLKDVGGVKTEAENFRLWREEHYVPVLEAMNNYSSLKKGREILAIAKDRSQKIAKDLVKTGKVKSLVLDLQKKLAKANEFIADGEDDLASAEEMFQNTYILPLTVTSTEVLKLLLATTSLPMPTSTLTALSSASSVPLAREATTTTPAITTTTTSIATSSPEIAPAPPLSIKDLVKTSFAGVKDAYRIFIEMSGLVRKSL